MDVGSILNSLIVTDPRPSAALVTLLFDLLIGESWSKSKKFTIKAPTVISYVLEILSTCEDASIQEQIGSKFHQLLQDSQNLDQCCNSLRLPEAIIELMMRTKDLRVFELLASLLSVLGNHSLSGKQVKLFIDLLEKKENAATENPKRQLTLVQSFQAMTKRQGPHSYFQFDGCNGGIMVASIDRWPKSGYAFSAWVRIESMQIPFSNASAYQPRLFSFFTEDGSGVEAYFEKTLSRGNTLFLRTRVGSNATAIPFINYDFQASKWHFITIVHSYKILGRSEATLYVNGQLIQAAALKYPPTDKKAVNGYIGINPKIEIPVVSSFFG